MVNMFFPSAIHHGLYPSWIKPKTKRLTFVASLQSKKGVRAKTQCKDMSCLTSCFGLMTDSAVVDSALVDAALRKSGLISNGKE
jgi:hypothetical protein